MAHRQLLTDEERQALLGIPLDAEHIGFSGDFLWDRAAATAGQRRPLNLSQERMAA